MPYASNQGVRIHYHVEGNGPPLVLQHGFASNLEAWRQLGYAQSLQANYQVIMLDSRGHGASDKPHTPAAYALPERVGDVVAVLEALHLEQAHFFGYSMGGWIGFGMAKYAPQRVRSLILGGAHPYPDRSWEAFRRVDGGDAEAFMAALEAVVGEPIPAEIKPLVLANNLQALAAAAQERLSADEDLTTVTMPCLLFAGEEDARYAAVRKCAGQIPQAGFVALPGLNHIAAYVRSDLVVPHIMQFLATVPGRHT